MPRNEHPQPAASGKESPAKKKARLQTEEAQVQHDGQEVSVGPPLPGPTTSVKKLIQKKTEGQKKISNPQQQRNLNKTTNKELIGQAWTNDNPTYVPGKPMLSTSDLSSAGKHCCDLHDYYMTSYQKGLRAITLEYKEHHFLNGNSYFLVTFGDLCDLFNLDALDVSLVRCFTL